MSVRNDIEIINVLFTSMTLFVLFRVSEYISSDNLTANHEIDYDNDFVFHE